MDNPFAEIWYKLADGKRICIEVPIKVKELLEQSDRQIRSQRRQDRRRHDTTEYIDGETEVQMYIPQDDVTDLIVKADSYRRLYSAIDELPQSQRRRLLMRYLDRLTYRQIAEKEGVTHKTVIESIAKALRIIRKCINQ